MTTATIPDAPTPTAELVPPPLEGTIVPHVQQVTLPSVDEWRRLAGQANALASSGTLPKHLNGRPGAVMAVILKGRELGLAPIQSLTAIYFIEGTPTLSAHLMLALVRRGGHEVWFEETSSERATICAQRRRFDGSLGPVERITWTIGDAETANLTRKDNWKHYPAAMLRARATTALCRMSFSDVLLGSWYSPEELGARVDSQGAVISLPSPKEAAEAAGALNAAEDDRVDQNSRGGIYPPQDQIADDGGLANAVAPDVIQGETAPPAEETPLDRPALWAELLDQARIVGQSPQAFTNRWKSAHKRNIEQATTEELRQFVVERRGYVESYLASNPSAADNKPTGKQPECPPDPETGEIPADAPPPAEAPAAEGGPAETAPDGAQDDAPDAPDPAEPPASDPAPDPATTDPAPAPTVTDPATVDPPPVTFSDETPGTEAEQATLDEGDAPTASA